MRLKIDKCYKCLCVVCTRNKCPYSNRCNVCINNNFKYCFDCDFFENKHTAFKRFKIGRRVSKQKDMINNKLDYIIANMGLVEPVIDDNNTYDVLRGDMLLVRVCGYKQALDYVTKYQSEFKTKLIIKKVVINL